MTRRTAPMLSAIIAFKALKAVSLTALGILLIATRHDDPVQVLVRIALAVHLPLSSRLFERALRFAWGLTVGQQTALALTAFGYAVLMGSEGAALFFHKPWARWFTIGATSSLLPIEVYEIAREPHPMRIGVLLANVAVVIYLWRRKELFTSRPDDSRISEAASGTD